MDIIRALFPALEEIPYTSGKKIPRYTKNLQDVTKLHQTDNISAWKNAQWKSSKTLSAWYSAQENASAHKEAWKKQAHIDVIKAEALECFDRLARYSRQMAEILNPLLRADIEQCTNLKSVHRYHMKMLILSDQIEIFDTLPTDGL